ncbi:phosphatase PAP2 family protein [Bosea sp. NPDC055353]
MRRISLPIAQADRAITRRVRLNSRSADLALALGWLCDARTLLGAGAIWFLATPRGSEARRVASRFVVTIASTTAFHHVVKRVVDQKRPDRLMGDGRIKTGRSSDAMPSGHAMHAGAVAAFFSRSVRGPAGLWSASAVLAAARVAILAHWPSGVAVGFVGGVAIECCTRLISRFLLRRP